MLTCFPAWRCPAFAYATMIRRSYVTVVRTCVCEVDSESNKLDRSAGADLAVVGSRWPSISCALRSICLIGGATALLAFSLDRPINAVK